MTTELKMPLLSEPDTRTDYHIDGMGDDAYTVEVVQSLHRQWAELERVLGAARDALVTAKTYTAGEGTDEELVQVCDAIATIDAARSKEGGGA